MTEPAPTVEFGDLRTRLEDVGREVRDTREAHTTALERRDDVVTQALDQGMPVRAVARAVGVSHQRVTKLTLPRADRQ